MQTTPQKPSSIRFGSGVCKLNGLNLGLLDNAELEIAWNVIKIKAHNGQLPVKKKPDTVKFKAELYEVDLTNLSLIDSHGILTSISGGAATATDEAIKASGSWADGETLWFDYSNVTAITNVKNNGSAVTAGNYKLVNDGMGRYGVTNISGSPIAITGTGLTSTYAYTATTSKKLTISDLAKLVQYYEVKFENTDSAGKKFSLTIPQGYQSNNTTFKFVSDDATDEVMKVPFEFEATPDSSNQLLIIEDEQSVA